MVDLWAEDIGVSTLRPPVVILREQASLLGQKTKNIVTAEVKTSFSSSSDAFTGTHNIYHTFFIVAPAMDNYHYELFSVSHDSVELYPVTFDLDQNLGMEISRNIVLTADSEESFIDILGKIFKSERTARVVRSLLSQCSGLNPPLGIIGSLSTEFAKILSSK